MMQRTPEPEVMNGLEQSEAYAQADFSEVNQNFVDRFCDQYPDFEAGTLIDLGCGPADILVRLCHQRPSVKVVGVDGSEVMIHLAKEAVEKEGLEAQIDLVCGILPGAISPDARFDAISSNSLLHHLHDPGVLWSEVSRIAKPGAPVFVMDLIRPESSEDAQRLVDTYAANDPPVLRRDFYNSFLAAFTLDEVRAQLRDAGLEQLKVDQISDRHMAVTGCI
jgi:ubiquinone/menaquinone biosynthesis C-methylase UbiE